MSNTLVITGNGGGTTLRLRKSALMYVSSYTIKGAKRQQHVPGGRTAEIVAPDRMAITIHVEACEPVTMEVDASEGERILNELALAMEG